MARVLVTGASGFVGRHCLQQLNGRGHEVHAVSSKAFDPVDRSALPAQWHKTDLLYPAQVARLMAEVRPTHLLHLAWYTVPGKYWTAVENLEWVGASINLLRLFAEQGGERAVSAGTCAEYDWTSGVCPERTTPLSPATLYGVCKHALQLILDTYSRQAGLSAAWARIFFLYGPHENPQRVVASIIQSILRNESPACSHPDQKHDFLFIEDAASAFVALLESKVSGPVNIAAGRSVALEKIMRAVAARLKRPDLAASNGTSRTIDAPPLLVADVERLQKEVGWMPKYNLKQGFSLTIDWWKRCLPER